MKRIAILMALAVCAGHLVAEVPLLESRAEPTITIPVGRDEGQIALGPLDWSEPGAPTDLAVSGDGLVWISDNQGSRLVAFDLDTGQHVWTIDIGFGAERVMAADDAVVAWSLTGDSGSSFPAIAYGMRAEGSATAVQDDWLFTALPWPFADRGASFFPFQDVLIARELDGSYLAMLFEAESGALSQSGSSGMDVFLNQSEPTLSALGIRFCGDTLLSGLEVLGATSQVRTLNGYSGRIEVEGGFVFGRHIAWFIGVDRWSNHYLDSDDQFAVVRPDGSAVIVVDVSAYLPTSVRGAVDKEGNLYFLHSSPETGHILYRVDNTWWNDDLEEANPLPDGILCGGESGTGGGVLRPDATVRIPAAAGTWGIRQPPAVVLRSDPQPNADEVLAVPVGTEVRIVEECDLVTQIGILRAPWYLIETEDGTTGWILGSFLERD